MSNLLPVQSVRHTYAFSVLPRYFGIVSYTPIFILVSYLITYRDRSTTPLPSLYPSMVPPTSPAALILKIGSYTARLLVFVPTCHKTGFGVPAIICAPPFFSHAAPWPTYVPSGCQAAAATFRCG